MTRLFLLVLVACGSSTGPKPAPLANASEAWPAGDIVNLTWLVSPATVPHPKWPDTFLAPVELEISIGKVARRVKLAAQQGSLFPFNQTVCRTTSYPLEPGEVAKITFYEGGAGGYVVHRKQPEELEIGNWTHADGACPGPTGECPRVEQTVSTVQVPGHVKVQEAVVQVTASGGRTTFECPSPSP